MKLFKWTEGRQKGTLYKKFPLWYFRIWKWGFDAYILKYQARTVLHPHTDPTNGKHYRLNIGWGKCTFISDRTIFSWRLGKFSINLFRADLYTHSLFVFRKTIKLSFGFVKFD